MENKRGRGRPKLTTAQRQERDARTKVSYDLDAVNLKLLDDYIRDDMFTCGMSRAEASRRLILQHLNGLTIKVKREI